MEYRNFEKLGVSPSLLGFGCMRFPLNEDGSICEPEAEKMLDTAIGAGVTYIDTAYPYHNGDSEPFLGRVLKKYSRKDFFLATKLPIWNVKTLEDAKRLFQEQLDRLQVDYVDFYLLHCLDKEKWQTVLDLGLIPYFEEMKQQGKIRFFGFSFHDDYEVFETIATYRPWDFCQIQYNYVDTEHQAGTKGLKYAAERGLGVVIMEPLLGGRLANPASHLKKVFPEDKSPVEYALDFLWDQPEVSLLLSGMSDEKQVEENLEYAKRSSVGMATEQDKEVVKEAKRVFDSMALVGCTGCRYCMPCPFGLDIPKIFSLYNMTAAHREEDARAEYEALEKKAGDCRSCHHCEKECPQMIKVSEVMKEVAKVFEKTEA